MTPASEPETSADARRVLLVETTQYEPASPFFLDAVQELGYPHRFVDEAPFLARLDRSFIHKVGYRVFGRRPLTSWALNRAVLRETLNFHPALVVVVKGAYILPATLRRIKDETGAVIVNYATDDPFNPANSTPDLLGGIPHYDLYACTKRAIMDDVRDAGCRRVAYVRLGYKASLHFPEPPATEQEARQFSSDVAFVGGVDQDRLPYIDAVLKLPGISVALYGGYWDRHSQFRRHARGFVVGRDYRLALGGARICLCLVRRANRDGHVMRTFEIPACGGFMLAERTEEHLALFREGEDVAFFSSPEELSEKIRYYLAHEDERRRIAEAGNAQVTTSHHTYQDRLLEIFQAVTDPT